MSKTVDGALPRAVRAYGERRDFTRTPEPRMAEGRPARATDEPVFVIQEHAARHLHYDLRLELDGTLKSWAVPKAPSLDPEVKRLAVMVEDHPLDYASFEGTIPRGEYGAGEVRLWDRGTYSAEEHGKVIRGARERSYRAMREGLAEGKISFVLHGQRLSGSWTLVKTRRVRDKDNWLLIKHRDEASNGGAGPSAAAEAAQIEGEPAPFPASISPMLATPASLPESRTDDGRWLWEPKLDGYRIVALIRRGAARLLSRNAIDVTDRYPDVARQLGARAAMDCVLDGEMVAVDENGRPCFRCLQDLSEDRPRGTGAVAAVVYYVFDILYLGGRDLRRVPLQRRKEILGDVVKRSDAVRPIEHFTGDARAIFRSALDTGFEGIVGKRRDSVYEPGTRSRSWVKIKALKSDDFIVGGFSPGAGSRVHTFGALLLGQYDDKGRLRHAGNVGSGFDEETRLGLRRRLDAMRIAKSPFDPAPPLKTAAWVRPELVVEVRFDQRTGDGHLRIPVFLRVRDDKPPGVVAVLEKDRPPSGGQRQARPDKAVESVLDQLEGSRDSLELEVGGQKVDLTNLSKVLWPSDDRPIAKRDLLMYLARASPHLLRHSVDRPLSLTRYPDGVRGPHFYQKHWPGRLPGFVETVRLHSRSEGWQQYLLCQNLATLLWLGQMANLEFHVWFSRVTPRVDAEDIPEFGGPAAEAGDFYSGYPDFIIFDLDPFIYSGQEPKGAEPELSRQAYARTCRAALWLKEMLDGLSLASFVKTSGRTGLHVYAPVVRHFGFDAVRQAAATIATRLLQDHPRDITLEWAVEKRTGKVFVDYNQNVQGKTLACAYSPRPSPVGAVSFPIRWDEIEKVYPTDSTILTAPARLAKNGDPWQRIMQSKSDLRSFTDP